MPYNMCMLKGFPTTLAKNTTLFPFGVWFANANNTLCCRRGQRYEYLQHGDWDIHRSRRADHCGTAKVGLRRSRQWNLEYVLTAD